MEGMGTIREGKNDSMYWVVDEGSVFSLFFHLPSSLEHVFLIKGWDDDPFPPDRFLFLYKKVQKERGKTWMMIMIK